MLPILLVALWGPAPKPTLGDEIVAYARSKLGEKVGNGECTSLAQAALCNCNARRPDPVQGIWGDEIKHLRDLQPGDILQFENAVFVKQHLRGDGGLWTVTSKYPHHTAIVAQVRKRGPKPVLMILHQNAGPDGSDDKELKVVREWILEMATQRGGTVKAYRPTPRQPPPSEPHVEQPVPPRD